MLKSIKSDNKNKGNYGELLAYNYLIERGYEVLCRNFNCKSGEIDIIFKDKNEIVFGEIKTRYSLKYGFPAESVNYYKKKHILNTANYYLFKNKIENKYIRFDIIEIYIKNKPLINHIKNAFY
jgi:putative endonuclease